MPKYKNNTTGSITVDGYRLESNQVYETNAYLDYATLGLTLVTDTPMYNPIIHAEEVTASKTVTIPTTDNGTFVNKFLIHFYQEAGESSIVFNNDTNTPALLLYTTARWNIRQFSRTINDIRITLSGASPSLWVIIEKI